MKFEVIWTKEAEISLSEAIDYLSTKWYNKQILIFLDKLDSTISTLIEPHRFIQSLAPLMYGEPYSTNKLVEESQIIILSIRSNKRKPKF